MTFDYVLLTKAAELTGYTVKALERKIEKGELREGVHFVRAPDGRRLLSLRRFEEWITGKV